MSENIEIGPAYRYGAKLAAQIEPRWQKEWQKRHSFEAPNPVGDLAPANSSDIPADKLFVQDMFPYPSGAGLHVGHPLGYIATDVFARYNRMLGHNVLHTLGYDAFGLPAEQYAVQTGTHPRTTTEANIQNMERQLGRLGLGHDKRRAFATTNVDYYRWTQWIFLQVYNSWYDTEATNATGSQGKARPIAELIAAYEDGTRPWPAYATASMRDAPGPTWMRRSAPTLSTRSAWCTAATAPSTGVPAWAPYWLTKK